jgi:hypothetical protein
LTNERKALEMMRHAVGWLFRNAYCAERTSMEWAQWSGLVTLGLARFGPVINDGRDQYFHVTPMGISYLAKMEETVIEGDENVEAL